MSHKAALATITAAAALDSAGGVCFARAEHLSVWRGLYWAVTTATTVGYGDITPATAAGHIIAVIVMLTVVPLFAATFSLFTTGLTSVHLRRAEHAMKRHVDERLRQHLGEADGNR